MRAVAYAAMSGLAESLAGLLGAAVAGMAAGVPPWAVAFAAGAMLYVVSNEMISESHREGHEAEDNDGKSGYGPGSPKRPSPPKLVGRAIMLESTGDLLPKLHDVTRA